MSLPFLKDEKHRANHHKKTHYIVPLEVFLEIKDGKDTEDGKRDDFLNRFKLGGGKGVRADAIGGDLKAVFDKGNAPAYKNCPVKRRGFIFQMTVPGDGHKDVGNGQQDNCLHGYPSD
jgi:hypothetical protein